MGAIFADPPADQLADVLPPAELAAGQLTVPYAALLVDTGAYRILVDTGAGPFAATTGGLVNNLRAARDAVPSRDRKGAVAQSLPSSRIAACTCRGTGP